MNHIKRIENILAGIEIDPPSMNLWKHFPPYDEDPKELYKKICQFQERFDWDFVKITYHGLYSIRDWGSEIKWPERDSIWPNTCSNVGVVTSPKIQRAEDWAKLNPLKVEKNSLADAIEVAKATVDKFKNSAPVIATVFNPLTTAAKMCDKSIFTHMRENSDLFKKGLEVITETTKRYVKKLTHTGIDGIFYATQLSNHDQMSIDEYKIYGEPFDREILEIASKDTWFNIVHMHGMDPMFELLESYPVQAVSWHDRLVSIDFKEGRKKTDKIIIGGIEEFDVLPNANNDELKSHINEAINSANNYKYILGPGCCVPLSVSEDRFQIAKNILESI